MPICKRDGFDLNQSQETFHDNDLVFCCYITKRIFRDYEEYFRHVMAINSTVWQCEATGKDGLTYEEAVKSERLARKKMEQFKQSLRAPVLLVIEHACQSAVKTLTLLASKFLRKRFFLNEEVNITTKRNQVFKVIGIKPAENAPKPVNGVYEETEQLEYRLCAPNGEEVVATFEQMRRKRDEFNHENLSMFIKNNVIRVEGLLRPKPEIYKQYVTEPNVSFSSIFIGKMPRYSPSKIKRPDAKDTKKQSTLNKFFVNSEEVKAKSKVDDKVKDKSLGEEMERRRLEKQAKVLEEIRQKAEKKAQKKAALMLRVEEECNYLTIKTDDLERVDQSVMPTYHPIVTLLPDHLLGDAFMLREFIHTYRGVLSGAGVLTQNLTFYEMSRAFSAREVAGPLSDILIVLLGTIFDMQREEEDECPVRYSLRRVQSTEEPYLSMYNASHTARYAKRHYSFNLNVLPLDALTLSEVLRLHLLSSGAALAEKSERWRYLYRNGYASREDPGLELLLQHPHILHLLRTHTIGHLDFVDIMRVINCLMAQILTYSASITVIDKRMERITKVKGELRALAISENRRLAAVEMTRRKLTNEHNQECMSDEVKLDMDKRQALDEKLNRRVANLLVQSDREQRKYDFQIVKLHTKLFNFLVYLGMDRCYRKYYVLESMPGIFIEHSPDSVDTCLSQPPLNKSPDELRKQAQLPKMRKDLRIYLLKLYGDDSDKRPKNTGKQSLENKENQENLLINDHGQSAEPMDLTGDDDEHSTPTQTELLMCSGDATNCIVHNEQHDKRQIWTYIHQKDEIDALIRSLNPLGLREAELLEELTQMRALIEHHVKYCPHDMLSLDSNQKRNKFVNAMKTETNRKYGQANFGLPENTDLNEVMRLHLIDCILQLETDIFTGDLGKLKVKDMDKWREQLLADEFDAQCTLRWGPGFMHSNETDADTTDNINNELYDEEACQFGRTKYGAYRDPGQHLRQTDVAASTKVTEAHETQVRNLASALLQVEQAVGRRFLKEPFSMTTVKKPESKPENHKLICAAKLQQWELSLMQSTNYAQIFLHMNVLHDSILWKRSTMKSLCKVCRRGTDPEKMLLCDECNDGTHMFCMKPKMLSVPEGNWYCQTCVRTGGFTNATADDEQQEQKKRTAQKKCKFEVEDADADDDEKEDGEGEEEDGDGEEEDGEGDEEDGEGDEEDGEGDEEDGEGEEEGDVDYEEAEQSDTQDDDISEASSSHILSSAKSNGRATATRLRSSRRLKSKEIEEALDDDDDNESVDESSIAAEENDGNSEEEESYQEEEGEAATDQSQSSSAHIISVKTNGRPAAKRLRSSRRKKSKEIEDEDENELSSIEAEHNEEDEETEVEKVCQTCFYDGCEICCARCSEWYHLECVKLKRQPRTDFVCKKCKSNEKPRTRRRLSHDGDADDDEDREEPQAKRSRNSLRNSVVKAAANSSTNNNNNNNNNNTSNHNNNRRSGRRTNDDLPLNGAVLYDLLEQTMKHKASWPFLRPVLNSEVPDYHKIIKTPMDLAKIKSKLNMGQYQINEEVLSDIQLVFKNCDLYNVEGNEIYDAGSELERFVMSRCKDLMLPFRPSDMNATEGIC
ncbi:bromodomain adjacent to zinc finger domain protein 1A [Drosophila grimshawi]|uniref:GH13739 n=1 Tax=Drosophila grimshawi TaxID=7222 RepID=B4JTS1_DROGR|nr:bromodomain adjacent to zinc finger domain protein 1A [Drosophila grimshawi]EDV91500.1 GH13739 [Drosophila grimshawi]